MKYLKNRRGEGYIDICVMIIAFVSGLVIAINVFSFITLKVEMDTIEEELIESATYEGEFGDEFRHRTETMKDIYPELTHEIEILNQTGLVGSEVYAEALERVNEQLSKKENNTDCRLEMYITKKRVDFHSFFYK